MRTLLEIVQSVAPLAGWNAETDEKFVHQKSGAFYRYSELFDGWFYGGERPETHVTESEVKSWIDDLAKGIGYIEPNSIQIPEQYLNLARYWYGGQDDLLYAIVSTGNLTTGTHQPRTCDTLEKWYLHLWRQLSIDVAYARLAAENSNHHDTILLTEFEDIVNDTCSRLAEGYGLTDWDGDEE